MAFIILPFYLTQKKKAEPSNCIAFNWHTKSDCLIIMWECLKMCSRQQHSFKLLLCAVLKWFWYNYWLQYMVWSSSLAFCINFIKPFNCLVDAITLIIHLAWPLAQYSETSIYFFYWYISTFFFFLWQT